MINGDKMGQSGQTGQPGGTTTSRNSVARMAATFVLLRMMETAGSATGWNPDLPRHREMIYLLRDSNPQIARQFVEHCVGTFGSSAHSVWWPGPKQKRKRKG
jgi:hypothetical protein